MEHQQMADHQIRERVNFHPEKTVKFMPIFWRLYILRILPGVTPWLIGNFIAIMIRHYQRYYPVDLLQELEMTAWVTIVLLIIGLILTAVFSMLSNIMISEDHIGGPGSGIAADREVFPIADLDRSNLYQQSFFEKILGFYTLRSIHGKKITFAHFLYGKSAVSQIYRMLAVEESQPVG